MTNEVWKCCGCGKEAPNLIKQCDCATMCAGLVGTGRHAWMTLPADVAERDALAAARAEGFRAGMEEALKIAERRVANYGIAPMRQETNLPNLSVILDCSTRPMDASEIAAAIRVKIEGEKP